MPFPALPPIFAETLTEKGYEEPTAVQSAVLEEGAAGRDLIVSAQTGSGKTVAFGLSMAADLLGDADRIANSPSPLALVIAPTRELALQVSRELMWLFAKSGARVTTCVGGMDPSKERRALRQGVQIVVGTPGRLRDHLERGALDLSALRTIILDEADEMLDMGFREDLEAILDGTPDARRTLMFSATIPAQILNMARRYQNDALRISTVGDNRGHGDITYQAVSVSPAEIEQAVVNLLRFHEAETAMLFCATRDNVRRLHATLQERGFGVVALSGEHSQSERNQALQALRDRRARVCVATDVASRGIDLPTLSLVVHVEIPRDAEVLQHRSGRTGRAGNKGTAVLVVPYNKRKRVESMLRGAKVKADWIEAPTPESIRANDRERLIEALLEPAELDEEDREIATRLMAERTPEDIAGALVRMHRAKYPQAEELHPDTPDGRKQGKQDAHRPGFEDTVWFKMDVGRKQNAEPRWVMPLLCRRGHITRNEIGAIRIGPEETHFQIPRHVADKFMDAVRRTADLSEDGGDLRIVVAEGPPPHPGRPDRKGGGYKGGPRGGQTGGSRGAPRGGPAGGPKRGPHSGNARYAKKGKPQYASKPEGGSGPKTHGNPAAKHDGKPFKKKPFKGKPKPQD